MTKARTKAEKRKARVAKYQRSQRRAIESAAVE